MRNMLIGPTIHTFDDFKEFADEFKIGEGDLVVTNEYIFDPYMKALDLKCDFMFQEKYGIGEPSDTMLNGMIADFSKKSIKRIIAVGGGSVMDACKLLTFKDITDVLDVFDRKIPLIRDKEIICVPTTSGTGSEVTNISVCYFTQLQSKKGFADDIILPDHAVLIPSLMKSLPFHLFSPSAIDALIHAVESYVSPKSNPFTELFGVKAIELLIAGFRAIEAKGPDYRFEILKDFALASTYAGISFGIAGCGAVHAMSYPLGGKYHVPHGESNYVMFTEIFKTYNKLKPVGKIQELNKLFAKCLGTTEDKVYDELESLLFKMCPKKKLSEYGMTNDEIELFTDNVIAAQQRLLGNNYVPFERQTFIDIYTALF